MAFDQDACDLYTIITGILQEDVGKDLEDVEVYEVTACDGGCNDSRTYSRSRQTRQCTVWC